MDRGAWQATVHGVTKSWTHPGSQASSRGEAKDTALLSSRGGYILELTVWPKMSQASCGVWREDSVLEKAGLSSHSITHIPSTLPLRLLLLWLPSVFGRSLLLNLQAVLKSMFSCLFIHCMSSSRTRYEKLPEKEARNNSYSGVLAICQPCC